MYVNEQIIFYTRSNNTLFLHRLGRSVLVLGRGVPGVVDYAEVVAISGRMRAARCRRKNGPN